MNNAIKEFYDEEGVLKIRPECKSISDLERVIALNKPQSVVLKFAQIIVDYQPWVFFDKYQSWLLECEKVDEHDDEHDDKPAEPVRPEPLNVDDILAPYKITLFKSERSNTLLNSTVTTKSGKRFNSDEVSINRMNNAITAMVDEKQSYIVKWSTDDVPTGVMVDVKKSELKEAHRLAIEQMSEIWKVD